MLNIFQCNLLTFEIALKIQFLKNLKSVIYTKPNFTFKGF